MRINYNSTAMRANNSLNVADNRVAASLQKLSSGLKVNSAKDNPSGYAIGNRMDTQIRGISVATRNANTGISVIETADGALTEVHAMLQRMNELAVKGENGTLTTADRATLDEEMKQLKAEVTRIAQDTEFNGQALLNGSFDLKGYTNNLNVKVGYYSDEVPTQVYTVDSLAVFYKENGKIDLDLTKAHFVPGKNFPDGAKIASVGENCVTIKADNGFEITLDIAEEKIDYTGTKTGDFSTSSSRVKITDCSDNQAYTIKQLDVNIDSTTGEIDGGLAGVTFTPGENMPADAQVTNVGTNTITIEGSGGFSMTLEITPEGGAGTYQNVTENNMEAIAVPVAEFENMTIDITGIGAMDTQIGANEGQILDIRIPTISLQRLGLTHANLLTQESSGEANTAIKAAIQYVSDVRSRLGAYQNRLEHTVNSLDVTNENMTSSYSRIMDVDVAEEMTFYTSQQVVEQAAISMLAQANERPSQVLQLLQ